METFVKCLGRDFTTVSCYVNFNIAMIIPRKCIRLYPNNKPWMNNSLRRLVIEKHHAFTQNMPSYHDKQLSLNRAIRRAKIEYKSRIEEMFRSNQMKDTWKGLKTITGQGKQSNNNALITAPGSADRLNLFFARFDCIDFSEVIEAKRSELRQRAAEDDPPTISERDVLTNLKNLCTKKASGPDQISAKVLKHCADSLLPIIHYIFQKALVTCSFPSPWKIGKIIPVSKKPIPQVDNDLRPVTLTPIIAKCFERLILPMLMSYVRHHLDNMQFAYLPRRGTDDAIATLFHELSRHLDKGKNYARCLFIDYSSAFNTIQPHILLQTLSKFQVPPRLQLLVLSFLTSRQQYVCTSTETSAYIDTNTGAPQGCVLSAVLFIIYTDSMKTNNDQCKIIKYADDTVVMGLISDDDELTYRNSVEYVSNWCQDNFLNLNVSKTKELILDFRRDTSIKYPVVIQDTDVENVQYYKYLGVNVQNNLKWDKHVKEVQKKVNKRYYFVRCLANLNVDRLLITLFYNSVVSSVLCYAIATWWNCCTQYQKDSLIKHRSRVCRLVRSDDVIHDPTIIYVKMCRALATKIINDDTHPLNTYFTFLPHGRLLVTLCRTKRFQCTFVPSSINMLNP